MKFYPAKITTLDHVTKDVITLSLELVDNQLSDIDYYPGHHVIVRIVIDGVEHRRPYALTNTPFLEEGLSIAIKKIKAGVVSSYFHTQAAIGMEIEISAAQGFFYADINSEVIQAYYLIAQGIGIAPIYSILKSILDAETVSRVFLFYESTDRDNIVFKRELDLLVADYPNRLVVTHTLSNPSLLPSLKPWKGQKGKIDKLKFLNYIEKTPITSEKTEFFICSSPTLNDIIYTELVNLEIDPLRIHKEQFYIDQKQIKPSSINGEIQIRVEGKEQLFTGNKSENILSTLQSAGQNIPYACQQGICGTCAAKLIDGEVIMENQRALEGIDVDGGWILTCQACPVGDVVVSFDAAQLPPTTDLPTGR